MGGERGWALWYHGRHALSKALWWRDRLAAGALRAICGGGTFVCVRGGYLRNRPGLLFAFGAAIFETGVVDWTPQFLFALGWLVLVLSFGAVWLLYFLIRRVSVSRVASLFYLTPPVTALMAWALFDERLAPLALLGMAVCVLGVFLVNWKPKEI